MQDFSKYDYSIQLSELEKTVRDVIEHGYSVTVCINGEYYDIKSDRSATSGNEIKGR